MTTRITGTGVETGETNTDTLTGGITDGQLIRGLLDRGLSLGANGEVIVDNAQKLQGKSVADLLGMFSFAGNTMRGAGDGKVIRTNTDASGTPTSIQINPKQDHDVTNFSGEVTQNGSEHIGEPGGDFNGAIRYRSQTQLPQKAPLWQIRSFNGTPIATIENGFSSRTVFANGTIVAGGDYDSQNRGSSAVRYLFGNTTVGFKGTAGGGIVARDANGNTQTVI